MTFVPYLNLPGTAREALTFYAEVFQGQPVMMPFSNGPEEFAPPGKEDWLMHGQIDIDGKPVLMASDVPPEFGEPTPSGTIYHECASPDDARRVFAALSDGGTVGMPLDATFWSPLFGMVTDRFGTNWAITIPDAA